jgi:hypothetical protein
MNCPNCGYEFDPSHGLECPRCGQSMDCGAISCGECGGCSGLFGGLRRRFRGTESEAGES